MADAMRYGVNPATPADFHRLAATARQRGLKLFREAVLDAYLVTSNSDERRLYAVDPIGGCHCEGYQKWGRCSHHALLIDELWGLPELADEPAALAPVTPAPAATAAAEPGPAGEMMAELQALRDEWRALQGRLAVATRAGDTAAIGTVTGEMSDFRQRLALTVREWEADGVPVNVLRRWWRATQPEPAPVPGLVDLGDAEATLAELAEKWAAADTRIVAARRSLELAGDAINQLPRNATTSMRDHAFQCYAHWKDELNAAEIEIEDIRTRWHGVAAWRDSVAADVREQA